MRPPLTGKHHADEDGIDVVTHHFEILGEASRHIPESIVEAHPAIPWGVMQDMRNRLIHGYFRVDATTLWLTAQNDLPELTRQLKALAAETAEE